MKIPNDKFKVSCFFSRDIKNIITLRKNSHDLDFDSLKKKFDLIFIDGDHSFDGVLNGTLKTFSLRKNNQSIIVWHDYGYSTEKVRSSVLAAILEGIPREFHKNLFHVSNTLCAIYIERNDHKTSYTEFPTFPNINFKIQVNSERILKD